MNLPHRALYWLQFDGYVLRRIWFGVDPHGTRAKPGGLYGHLQRTRRQVGEMKRASVICAHRPPLLIGADKDTDRGPDNEIPGVYVEDRAFQYTGLRPDDLPWWLPRRTVPVVEEPRGSYIVDNAEPFLPRRLVHARAAPDDLFE